MTQPIDLVTVGSLFMEITPTTPREALTEAHQYTLVAGGAAANVVFALARLGVLLRFITAVGDDEFGTLAAHELAAFGVDTSGVRRVPGQLTPVSFCSVDGKGGKFFRFYRFPGVCSPMEMLAAEDFAAATACRLFDFSEGSIREPSLRPLVFQAGRDARAAGVPVLYALNLRMSSWKVSGEEIKAVEREAISLADILVLNAEELEFLTGKGIDDGLRAVQALGPRAVVLTQGGDGDVIVRVGEEQAAVPPFRVPVVYDVGAGDTFHAGLVATALRMGEPDQLSLEAWTAAARFAAATAAIRVSTSADPHDLPSYAEVEGWLAARDGS